MKKILGLFIASSFVLSSYAAPASVEPSKPKMNASEIFVPIGKTGKKISLMDLSQIKVKDLETITGKKMKLKDKLSFKFAQKRLANSIQPDGTIKGQNLEKLNKKFASEQSRKYLRLWLILLGVAIVLSIIGVFVPFLWIVSGLAGLGAAVFFVLWLIALADS